LSGYINNLKLRFSYGELGNENIPDYLYSTTLSPNFNYVSGPGNSGQLWNGSIQTNYASKDIKWEDCKTTNFGADIGLFKNKLTLTADYYIKVNSDLLMQLPIPLSTGATNNPWVNFGQITNKGIELAVNFKDNIGKLSYSVYGTLTSIKNNVDEMGTATQQIIDGQPNQNGTGVTITEAGYPVGSFYLIQTAGIFKSQAEINSYIAIDSLGKPILNSSGKNILLQPNAKPGDIKFVDANKDGVINQEDRVVCGSPTPKLEYSFGFNLEWKGIDMSMYFQGVYGNKIYNGLKMDLVRMIQNWNYSTAVLDHWTPANPNSSEPRLTYLDKNQNDQVSSRFLEDGSYLRIKTLQIGYTIPKSWTTKAGIDQLRFFVSVDNLYTFTNYSGFNPDLGRDSNSWRDDLLSRGVDNGQVAYPLARTITGGIQLTF
jgi:TonB-linked SusC/RagA family outer membrane protein